MLRLTPHFLLARHSCSDNRASRFFWLFLDAKNHACTSFALDRFSNGTCPSPRKKVRQFRVGKNSGCTFPFAS